jgi:hypothetical protein
MPALLLVLGVLTTVAGLVLAASGLTIREGALDTEVVTPGTIAAVGGLILVGLALAIRELQRIERALAARPMPRVARPGEATAAAEADTADASVRIPFPPKPNANPQPAAVAGNGAAPASGEDATFERLRVKFPSPVRTENASVTEAVDVKATPAAGPVRVEESVAEAKTASAVARAANGAAAPGHVVPRLEIKQRPMSAGGKPRVSVFNTFWPAAPRRDGQTASAQAAAPAPPPSVELAREHDAAPAAGHAPAPPPVSVLKSGVVEGMAYTLYSDGSIEAQLPQGTLRFGSITALRNHIESTT